MMTLDINGHHHSISSIEELAPYLDDMERTSPLEAWLTVPNGPLLNMLRSGQHAFLMYLRNADGDAGFTSRGEQQGTQMVRFTLANGQEDQYPIDWCVGLSLCFRAFAYFCANEGARTPEVHWHDDSQRRPDSTPGSV